MPAWIFIGLKFLCGVGILIFCWCLGLRLLLAFLFRADRKLYGAEMQTGFPSVPDSGKLSDFVLSRLWDRYRRGGFFPTYLRVCMAGDARYSARAMREDLQRDPDIRWLVALLSFPQALSRKEKSPAFSLPIHPRHLYTAGMDFCLFNALIAERLIHFDQADGLREAPLRARVRAMVDGVVARLLAPESGFTAGGEFLYKVSFRPNLANRTLDEMMTGWSRYADSDSSAFVLSLFGQYRNWGRTDREFQALAVRVGAALTASPFREALASVFQPAAHFTLPVGRNSVTEESRAFLTYFTQGANDADPVVNMDILEALAVNYAVWNLKDDAAMLARIRAALAYIRGLAENGSLFTTKVHQYYTAPACAFLWYRLRRAFQALDDDARRRFDPDAAVPVLQKAIDGFWSGYRESHPDCAELSLLDAALLAGAYPEWTAAAGRMRVLMRTPPQGCEEFFCAVYPIKVIYGNPDWTLALALTAASD